jgi:hypothetical protein
MNPLTLRLLFSFVLAFCVAAPSMKADPAPNIIIGSTKAEVDALLSDWRSVRSHRSTDSRQIFYYYKDVELIVSYRHGKAIGVHVIDIPGKGVSPIPARRFQEIISIIGDTPKPGKVIRDDFGIREFSVAEAG